MRVPCLLAVRGDEVAERLNTGNRAGENVIASEYDPIYIHDRLPRCAVEPTQETPIEPEKNSQPLRDRPYDLPMRNPLADTLRNSLGQQKRPLLMATGTKAPLLTREGHEHLVRTPGAPDSGEFRVMSTNGSAGVENHERLDRLSC